MVQHRNQRKRLGKTRRYVSFSLVNLIAESKTLLALKTPFEVIYLLLGPFLCLSHGLSRERSLKQAGKNTFPEVASITITCVVYFLLSCSVLTALLKTDTKESKWDMPDELLLVLEKVEKEVKPAPPT